MFFQQYLYLMISQRMLFLCYSQFNDVSQMLIQILFVLLNYCIHISFKMQPSNQNVGYFLITPSGQNVSFQQCDASQMYNSKRPSGFVRKAILKNVQSNINQLGRFTDGEFKSSVDNYRMEVDLFPFDETESSFIDDQKNYNSFMAESGVISYGYLKTLFITQTVNERGYYQYFVKRNGEYFVEECDDYVPVDKTSWKLIWGLTLDHPWQIMLFKAWLKQCRSIENMNSSEPFSFLQAFGLPEYRVFNFRKQHRFLTNEKVPENDKKEKLNNFTMNDENIVIVARTVNSEQVRSLGLSPNTAGYRITKTNVGTNRVFRVYSSIPCYWVGSLTAISNTPLNKFYNQDIGLDLERAILMSEQQVLTCFNKFYAAPLLMSEPSNIAVQDCINIPITGGKPVWFKFTVHQVGMLAFSIEVPKARTRKVGSNNFYPQFRYFLSKRNDEQEMSRSHFREDIAGSRLEDNMYISSNCDKWEYYRIDYVQGYENHAAIFTKGTVGDYVLFIDAEMTGNIRLRNDSHVKMDPPTQFEPSANESKQIFDSTFFSISRDSAVEATFNQATFEESITLNNSFEQLGFGSICIKTLTKAKHKVAMRVYPQKLRAAGYQLLSHYEDYQNEGKEKNVVLISSKGRPEIIVLERITNRSRTEIGEVFPPIGTVQFFKVVPNKQATTSILNAPIQPTSSTVKK